MTVHDKAAKIDRDQTLETTVEDVASAAGELAETGAARMGDVLSRTRDAAQNVKDAAVSGASATLASVRDAAVEKADDARETLSDVGDRIAATLQRASEDGDALKSRVMASVADGLTKASATLRSRSVAELTDDVKLLAKRHPGAFMAAAAVAGFAAARFVRASARRRADQAMYDDNRERRS